MCSVLGGGVSLSSDLLLECFIFKTLKQGIILFDDARNVMFVEFL